MPWKTKDPLSALGNAWLTLAALLLGGGALSAQVVRAVPDIVLDDSSRGATLRPGMLSGDGGPSACNDYSDSAWLQPSAPRWAVRAGAVALHRSAPDSSLLFFQTEDSTEKVDASDFDFGYRAGIDVSVLRRFDELPDVELRYLGNDAWSAYAQAADMLAINARNPVTLDTARDVRTAYGSELHSLEINLRSTGDGRMTWLAGFRYLELDENLHADFVDDSNLAPIRYDIGTRNRLYGAQLGVEAILLNVGHRFRLDAVAKAGVFGNNGAQLSTLDSDITTLSAAGSAGKAAFVGEAHLAVVYRVAGRLSLRASYGVLGITNTALATDQVNATSFIFRDGIDGGGDVFYHGALLGLEYGY